MNRQDCTKRDPYAFSLGGFTATASFVMPHAMADDYFNRAYDARMKRAAGQSASCSAAPNWDSAHCLVHQVDLPCDCHAA